MIGQADTVLPTWALDELGLESALIDCGWEQRDPLRWRLSTARGESWLTEIAHRERWRQFELSGSASPQSTSAHALYENRRLRGPAKLVAQTDRPAICRLDVPDDLTGSASEWHDAADGWQQLNPQTLWARSITACASGSGLPAPNDQDESGSSAAVNSDQTIADELKRAGWSTSIDDGRFIVHVQLPGVYRQLRFEHDTRAGCRLTTELTELANLSESSIQAILAVAGEVNARLPLVRLAVDNSSPSVVLCAEVNFGATLIPGTMLLHTLHVLEAAVALTVRELEALHDDDLARLVVAAKSVREYH